MLNASEFDHRRVVLPSGSPTSGNPTAHSTVLRASLVHWVADLSADHLIGKGIAQGETRFSFVGKGKGACCS